MKKISLLLALLLLSVCLVGCGGAGKSAEKEALCTYTVFCQGEDGAGLAGVMINFCTDSACTPVTSGEDGAAVFTTHVYPTQREFRWHISPDAPFRIWKLQRSVTDEFVV